MARVKKSQLKALIKEIIREVKSALISENYLSRSDLDLGTMKAVNVEEDVQPAGPWTPTGGNLYKISPELATELLGGKPAARAGYEALVPAPKGFKTDKGFVWLSQKVISGQMSWIIRNSGNWVMKGGKITVVGEQSVSGGAGAYSTPFAFKKKTNEVMWDKPEDKVYTNLAAWEIDNIDVNGIYKGEPLSNYGFPYKVGQKVEGGPGYRLLAMRNWNDAKKKQNQNLALGKPVGIEEMTSTGAVAGYQTPFAFSKNKSGSKRALDVTTKMGYKKVGDAPRV